MNGNPPRKSGGQQAKEILGFMFEGLVTGRVPDKVQEGLVDEAQKFLGTRQAACPKCSGELEELETADGHVVQVCPACAAARKK
jgi:hypothetical protein